MVVSTRLLATPDHSLESDLRRQICPQRWLNGGDMGGEDGGSGAPFDPTEAHGSSPHMGLAGDAAYRARVRNAFQLDGVRVAIGHSTIGVVARAEGVGD